MVACSNRLVIKKLESGKKKFADQQKTGLSEHVQHKS